MDHCSEKILQQNYCFHKSLRYMYQYPKYKDNGEVYSIQHYVIEFVSDMWQVCGFLRVLRFPPPIKFTATI
jgi:hypothetical protein